MIARHLEMRDACKSRITRLVNYITSGVAGERIGTVRVTNCLSDPRCMKAVVAEMLATQECNQRTTKDKTYHLLISFRPGECPTDAMLADIEERLCASIGFTGHQRISAVHMDTDNVHLHIAINKIHPERLTIHEPYRAYNTMARVCEALEAEYGLQIDNHEARKCTDADRLLIVLDGLPRLLAALSGVHEYIWAGATIDDAIAAATQYFQTRFKDTDIRAELDRLEDTLNDMVDRLAAMRVTVFGE